MKNDYEVRGDVTAIKLSRKDGTVLETVIDTADLERVKEFPYTWGARYDSKADRYYVGGGMLVGKRKQRTVLLHRFIMGEPKGLQIDHVDRDTLNNRRSNLRTATAKQNQQNRGVQKNNKTGIRGVNYCAVKKKWQASVGVDRKIHLGFYESKDEAKKAVENYRIANLTYSPEYLERGSNV